MKNNFKRCLALLLAIMTIVGAFSIPVSAAEECDHDYQEIVKAPTCTTVGYTTKVCKLCDESEIVGILPKLEHNYQKATAAKAPTCSNPGYTKDSMVCKNCGDVIDEDLTDNVGYLKPVAENHVFDDQIKKDGPVCGSGDTTPVKVYKWCTECSEKNKTNPDKGWIYVGEEDAKPDHEFVETVVTAVACGKDGKIAQECKNCGFKTEVVVKGPKHDTTDVKETLLTKSIKVGNTTYNYDKNTHVYVKYCRVCGAAAEARTEKHSYVENRTFDDSCKNPGYFYKTCSVCKRAEKVSVEDKVDMAINETRHTINVNDPKAVVAPKHTLKDGIVAGYKLYECYLCDAEVKVYDVDATGDSYAFASEWHTPRATHTKMTLKTTNESYVAPTCLDNGLGRYVCECGYEKLDTIPATGHKYNKTYKEEGKVASSTDGYSCKDPYKKWELCEYCGEAGKRLVDSKDPSTKHPTNDVLKNEKATCFKDGVKEEGCSVCNKVVKKTTTPKLTNHESKWTYTDNGQTGCFVEREVYTYCSTCKVTNTTKELYNSHLYDEAKGPEVLEAATCSVTGKLGYKCTRVCIGNDKNGNAISVKKLSDAKNKCTGKYIEDTIPFDKDNHAGGKIAALSKKTYDYKLSGVDYTIDLVPGELSDITIAKTGAAADYDCYDLCYTWWYCESCDKEFEKVSEKTKDGVTYLSGSVNHIYTPDYTTSKKYPNYKAPTCTENGLGAKQCDICGYRIENQVILATGHNTKDVTPTETVPSTCVTLGFKVYICKNANCTVKVYETKYADHTFAAETATDKWTVTKKPTCVAKGSKYTVCTVSGCEEKKTVEIAMVPHGTVDANGTAKTDHFEYKYKAPTCLETGYDYYKCKGCNKLYEYDKDGKQVVVSAYTDTKALGHTDTRKSGTTGTDAQAPVVATCTTDGYTPETCKDCGLERIRSNYVFKSEHKPMTNKEAYDAGILAKAPASADEKKLYTGKAAATCFKYAYTYNVCSVCKGECNEVYDETSVKPPHVNADGYPLIGDCRIILGNAKCDVCKGTGVGCADCIKAYTCANKRADGKTACGEEVPAQCAFVNETVHIECNAKVSACKFCGVGKTVKINDTLPFDHNYEVTVAPTTTTEGVETCKDCGYVNEEKLPKLVALTFSMDFYNPLDENGPVVNGGKVYVRVDMKAIEPILVNNIRVALAYDVDQLVFVGAVDNKSVFGELAQANAKDGVVYVFDDAGKERYNITIEGESEFVTLEFYVRPDACDFKDRLDAVISFVAPSEDDDFAATVSYYDVDASTAKEAVYSNYAFDVTTNSKVNLKVDQLGDFNNNGRIDSADLAAVRDLMIDLINGVEGAEYDAVLDIDHDGDIDMDDYGYIKEYMVNKYTYWQFADLANYNEFVADEKENGVAKEDKELSELQRYAKWLGPVAPQKV